MTHTYHINGMSCNGCKSHVETILSSVKGVKQVSVNLEKATANIEMEKHLPLKTFQKALKEDGGSYSIHLEKKEASAENEETTSPKTSNNGNGVYYCPMHCEGDKTYENPGDCPVCGMDLVEEQKLQYTTDQWTCPMHPEVEKEEPGDCPICGMDLVPKQPDATSEEKNYKKLIKKFWIAVAFTLPIFLIAMSEMIPENPLYTVLELSLIHI